MALRKNVVAASPTPVVPVGPVAPGSFTRTVAPFIPLAIPLLVGHSLLPSNRPTGTPTAITQPSVPVAGPTSTQPVQTTARSSDEPENAPTPLLSNGSPVDWFFVFKFNTASFPECSGGDQRVCLFGGTKQDYGKFSQQFAYASNTSPTLQDGGVCVGDTTTDPVGATFAEVYNGHLYYVVWNDQFYGDPLATKAEPAGHSKGMLAWDNNGNGLVLQVSTPSWPGSGSAHSPRQTDGNTLGCVKDNDVKVSQHFFGLKLNKDDVVQVLKALENSSGVTDPSKLEIVNNGGPPDIQALAAGLGKISKSTTVTKVALSSRALLISKPSDLPVPPWQMVSALLGGEPLRVASWWTKPEIPSTTESTTIGCWDQSLGKPGAVEIATSGFWEGKTIGLQGMDEPQGNHAKVGVSTGTHPYVILGDMNQQGSIDGDCKSSQNGRGGLFYVLDDPKLYASVSGLLKGDSALPK